MTNHRVVFTLSNTPSELALGCTFHIRVRLIKHTHTRVLMGGVGALLLLMTNRRLRNADSLLATIFYMVCLLTLKLVALRYNNSLDDAYQFFHTVIKSDRMV